MHNFCTENPLKYIQNKRSFDISAVLFFIILVEMAELKFSFFFLEKCTVTIQK